MTTNDSDTPPTPALTPADNTAADTPPSTKVKPAQKAAPSAGTVASKTKVAPKATPKAKSPATKAPALKTGTTKVAPKSPAEAADNAATAAQSPARAEPPVSAQKVPQSQASPATRTAQTAKTSTVDSKSSPAGKATGKPAQPQKIPPTVQDKPLPAAPPEAVPPLEYAAIPLEQPSLSTAGELEIIVPLAETAATHGVEAPTKRPVPPMTINRLRHQLPHYWTLMRLDKPIGTLLLLWPTLWSLWLAAKGVPRWDLVVIFATGVLVMRSAGCVINDIADRKIDGKVKRTRQRPLITGAISTREALGLFTVLCLVAFCLVLFTNPLTIALSLGGLLLAASYPFMKRYTHLPQVVLGAAFAWGIPMAFTAQAGEVKLEMWLIYLAVVLWTVAYDTFYAMVDRDDDLKIGVKSTAILFGEQDRIITGMLQALTLYALVLVGQRFQLGLYFKLSLAVAAGLFIYQQWLIRYRERDACLKAFLNNNWVGAAVFVGIAMDLALKA